MSSYKNVVTLSADKHLIGRVKWFNNKSGYGFITVTDEYRSGIDVFVHHSAINVEKQQYKYLVQGEYVEFDLIKVHSDKHEWQASCVSGISGGKLMCETRRDLKIAKNDYNATKSSYVPAISSETIIPRQKSIDVNNQRQRKTTAVRGERPRNTDNKERSLVSNKSKSSI